MSDATPTIPAPKPTPVTRPFWEAAKEKRLAIQRCLDCMRHYFYPRPLCPHCLSRNIEWTTASGRGKLHTFVISHRPPRQAALTPPYVTAIVELEEGPRLMTNLVGVEPDPTRLQHDMPVEVVFEELTEEITLPRFRPVST